jgi:non-specific serine/threonine protein kinase
MTLEEAVEYALAEQESAMPVSPAPEQLPASTQAASLTRREEEVVALVARGLTNRQIAAELSISEHTAATHVAKILKKLGLRSRTQIGSRLAEQ